VSVQNSYLNAQNNLVTYSNSNNQPDFFHTTSAFLIRVYNGATFQLNQVWQSVNGVLLTNNILPQITCSPPLFGSCLLEYVYYNDGMILQNGETLSLSYTVSLGGDYGGIVEIFFLTNLC